MCLTCFIVRFFFNFHACYSSGLDYVNHEDILPYLSNEESPIQHELFDKFLTKDGQGKHDNLFDVDLLSSW